MEKLTLCPMCKRGVHDLPVHADIAHGLVRLSDGFWYGIDTPDPTKGYHTCQRCYKVTEHVSEATGDYVCPCDTVAKFQVCPECEGEGFVGTLGDYTADEFNEYFESWEDYTKWHEASKVPCECCEGKRVVTSEDLQVWDAYQEMLAEQRAEQRAGC